MSEASPEAVNGVTNPSPNHSTRRCAVEAICVHWTGGDYGSALSWITSVQSQVSYHALIAPSGHVATVVPWDRSAWSVGVSQQPDDARFHFLTSGNSATENIALAGAPPVKPTPAAIAALVTLITARFHARGWGPGETWRIVSHASLAMPRGRKHDPEGDGWLPLGPVRLAVGAAFAGA